MSLTKQTRKQNLQKILSLAVTAVNTVNTMLPVALPYAAMAQEVSRSSNYIQLQAAGARVLDAGIQAADGLFFKTAEAAFTNPVSNTTVYDEVVERGLQIVLENGVTSNTTINERGWQYISQGGTAVVTTVNSGGQQVIYQDGTASNTTIESGAWQNIYHGGMASDAIISSGGRQYLDQGGTAYNTKQLSGAAVVVTVDALDGTVMNGTNALGSFGLISGVASNFLLENGAWQIVKQGGTATSTTIDSGGVQHISSGAVASVATINNSGRQDVHTDGLASSTVVNSGAWQHISAGAVASDTTINSGGGQYILEGGTAINTRQMAGAAIVTYMSAGDGTVVNGTNALGSFSLSNDVANNFLLENGGWQIVHQGTVASNTTIASGGGQEVYRGGAVSNTTIHSNGRLILNQGVTATDTQQLAGAAIVVYMSAGDGAAVNGANALGSFSWSNGVASNFLLENGGAQSINKGGIAYNTTINSDGRQALYDNTVAYNTTVNSRGEQKVFYSGMASNTVINNGGEQYVYRGGAATDTLINTGGYMWLESGAQALGNTTNNGGTLDLASYDQAGLNLMGTNGTVLVNAVSSAVPFSAGRNITLASLSGSQTFVINSDLANNVSDQISVNGVATGKHYIKIGREATAGSEYMNITAEHMSKVVATNGGNATFSGALSAIDGVNIMPKIVQVGNDWYLMAVSGSGDSSGSVIVGASKLALTADAAGHMLYAAVLATENNLQRRLGDLRENSSSSGVWLRTYGGEYALDGSSLKYTSIQGGYDWVRPAVNGKVVTGVTLEQQNGSADYVYGSGKLSNTRMGVYHAWLGNSGHYYDLVAKTGRLNSRLTAYDDSAAINASYKVWNTTLSAEYGYTKQLKHGYYIRPQAELTYSHINGANYTADSGTAIIQSGINSLVGRLGTSVGRSLAGVNYYLTASMLHEFAAKDRITVGSGSYASSFEHSFKGTSVELALGGNVQTGKAGNLYLETARSFGGKVVNKWKAQIGYRYNF